MVSIVRKYTAFLPDVTGILTETPHPTRHRTILLCHGGYYERSGVWLKLLIWELLAVRFYSGACLDGGAGARHTLAHPLKKPKSSHMASVPVPGHASGHGLFVCKLRFIVDLKGIGIFVCCLKSRKSLLREQRRAETWVSQVGRSWWSALSFFVLPSEGSQQELKNVSTCIFWSTTLVSKRR